MRKKEKGKMEERETKDRAPHKNKGERERTERREPSPFKHRSTKPVEGTTHLEAAWTREKRPVRRKRMANMAKGEV